MAQTPRLTRMAERVYIAAVALLVAAYGVGAAVAPDRAPTIAVQASEPTRAGLDAAFSPAAPARAPTIAVQASEPTRAGLDAAFSPAALARAAAAKMAPRAAEAPLRFSTTASLDSAFEEIGYQLASVRQGASVPRVALTHFPGDFHRLRETKRRKRLFVKAVLPLILQVNEELQATRKRVRGLERLADSGGRLAANDRRWLAMIAARYGTAPGDFETLARRVDIIPPSLALAQAAIESGWATSRYAREGNALFGQYSWGKGAGMVPVGRDEGARHSVRSFAELKDAVRSYAHNLNTHFAYRRFRDSRAGAREQGRFLDGLALSGMLLRYSARGQDYVDDVRGIIRANNLGVFDRARLVNRRSPASAPADGSNSTPRLYRVSGT